MNVFRSTMNSFSPRRFMVQGSEFIDKPHSEVSTPATNYERLSVYYEPVHPNVPHDTIFVGVIAITGLTSSVKVMARYCGYFCRSRLSA